MPKNFSIFLGPGGRFNLTPFYDVLTAQPSLDAHQIVKKQMKLAMFVGDSLHYTMDYIRGRHFIQTVERAGLPAAIAHQALGEIGVDAAKAMKTMESQIPKRFPKEIHASVQRGLMSRLGKI